MKANVHFVVLSSIFLHLAPSANAQRDWSGVIGNTWNTSLNWSPVGVPNNTETVTFPASGTNKSINYNVTGGSTHNHLAFTASGYTLSGSNTLTIGGSTAKIEASHASGSTDISTPLVLGAATLSAQNGALLRINSTAPISVGVSALFVDAGAGSSVRFGGNISSTSSAVSILKLGLGSLQIDSNQSYTGTYKLNDGSTTLNSTVQGPLELLQVASLSVSSGRTTSNAIMAGSLSVGTTFTVDGSLNFIGANSGSDLSLSINGTVAGSNYSQIRAGGTVTTGACRVRLTPAGGYAPDTEFILIRKDSAGGLSTGTRFRDGIGLEIFTASEATYGAHLFRFNYSGGDGNDFTATVVPAPFVNLIADWDGGGSGSNWRVAANWSSDSLPGAGRIVRFGQVATAKKTISNNYGGNYGGIHFTGADGGFTIEDAPPSSVPPLILLSGGNANSGIRASHSGAECLIKSPLMLLGNQSWSLTGTSGLTIDQVSALDLRSHTLTLNCSPVSGSPDLVVNAPITGTGGVTIQGTGNTVFGGGNKTHTGTTTVSSGTLVVNSSLSGAITSTSSGTLRGSGTVASVSTSGVVHPGFNTPGRLTATGAVVFNNTASSRLRIRLGASSTAGTTYDQLRCNSGLTIGASTVLELASISGFAPLAGQVYTLIDKTSAGAITGTFSGLPQNSIIDLDGAKLLISYTGGTGNDLTASVLPTVSVTGGSAQEGQNLAFTIFLSNAFSQPVTVNFATSNGTATAPGDYTETSGSVTIPAGQTSATVNVPTIDDNISEFAESVNMTLSNPVNAVPGVSTASGFINDNDPLPVLTVTPSGTQEVDEGVGTVGFTVTMDRPSERGPTFTVQTITGTANGADFTGFSTPTVFTFGPGETIKTPAVSITDDAVSEDTESFTVRFSTSSTHLAAFATTDRTVTILDNDPLPTVQVLNPLGVTEGGQIPLAVQVSPISGREVRVDYQTEDGSAQAPGDYTPVSGTFIIPPFTQFAVVQVPTIDDDVHEGLETFRLRISNPVNATLGTQMQVNAIINDNDPLPVVSVSTPIGLIAESVTPRIFTVSLDRPSAFQASVIYATENQSATAPDDYTPVSGTMVFAPGEVSRTVEVVVIDDEMDETAESFLLRISSPIGATLGTATAVTSINDNDPLPVLTVTAPGPAVSENAGTLVWTLTLDRPSQRGPRVDFLFTPGTATHPDDFNGPLAGEIRFLKGETSRTISLAIVDDDLIESDESFEWSLTNSQPLTLTFAGAAGTITILNDDFPDLVLSQATIHPGDEVTPPSISGVLTGGPPNGTAVAEVSTDLGSADPWTTVGTVEFDANGEATVSALPASGDHIGADILFFRFRNAGRP